MAGSGQERRPEWSENRKGAARTDHLTATEEIAWV